MWLDAGQFLLSILIVVMLVGIAHRLDRLFALFASRFDRLPLRGDVESRKWTPRQQTIEADEAKAARQPRG